MDLKRSFEITEIASAGEVTQLLLRWQSGDPNARDRLTTLLYQDLKRLAKLRLRHQRDKAINPTELLHETLARLMAAPLAASDRTQLLKIATGALRHTLLDLLRHQQRQKRGGGQTPITLTQSQFVPEQHQSLSASDWLDVEQALRELEHIDARKSQITELAFLAGFEQSEIANQLGISLATVERELRFCRAWLRTRLEELRSQ
jgi:RNA polymerase sigma factor (TIGR02999 family)